MSKYFPLFLLLLIVGFRVFRETLVSTSLDVDELYTWDLLHQSWSEISSARYYDVHLPLYFYIAKVFLWFFPDNDYWIRIPSVIFSLMSLTLISYLTRLKNVYVLVA